jgi:hypothetical protein
MVTQAGYSSYRMSTLGCQYRAELVGNDAWHLHTHMSSIKSREA